MKARIIICGSEISEEMLNMKLEKTKN